MSSLKKGFCQKLFPVRIKQKNFFKRLFLFLEVVFSFVFFNYSDVVDLICD